jgi:hypothetical protein
VNVRRRIRAAVLSLALVAAGCTGTTVPPQLSLPIAYGTPAPPAPRPVTLRVIGPRGGVADATVCAARIAGEEACATSGSDGRAVVQIRPGTYAVRATPVQGQRLAEGVTTVDLSESTSAVVTIEGRATIAGTIKDASGAAVREAEVCAHSATSDETKCTRTRADGTYSVEVRPGIQKIEVTGAPGSRLLAQWARGRIGSFEADVIDTRERDVTGVDLTLIRGVVLSGTVTAARDGSIVKDSQVCTYTLAAPLGWDCENTDKNGRYALLREPGQYWVWIIPPGVRGSRLMFQRYDRVLEGVDATPFTLLRDAKLDVRLTEGVILRGRVTTTSDGAPIVLALVCVDTPFPTGRICRETGDDGIYEVATRPQTYTVAVYPPETSDAVAGFWPDAQPDWTRAGEIRVGSVGAALDIVVPRGVRLRGTVRDARGAPIEGATINLNDGLIPRWFASTDIAGHYSVVALPGTYTIDVFPPRASPSSSVVGQRVTIASETGYDVTLPDAKP